MAEVNIIGLTKHFGDVIALDDVSFEIKDQEFVTMLGPTGAGKTTTLRCVAGLEKPDKGEVLLNGANINALPPGQRNMAFVSQHYALYPHMTVYKNLQFPLDKTILTNEQKKARIEEIAKILHIVPLLQRYPSKLSGGEMQRVVIGRGWSAVQSCSFWMSHFPTWMQNCVKSFALSSSDCRRKLGRQPSM